MLQAKDAEKLNFLKCSLSERLLLLINHLSYVNANYQLTLSVLKKEYLDVNDITDKIFQDIIDFSPKRECSYADLGGFISRTASILEELASSLDCNFSEDDSAGARLMGSGPAVSEVHNLQGWEISRSVALACR